MPETSRETFRGDPYDVLDVGADATDATIKSRWRELAREHHPDRAGDDRVEAQRLTTRMARINAAYDLLRDPARRAAYDARSRSGLSGRARARHGGPAADATGGATSRARYAAHDPQPGGPPPPRPSRPVTARFDTTAFFHDRNTVMSEGSTPLRGQRPLSARDVDSPRDGLRASQPTGPVERRTWSRPHAIPSLADARATTLEFGKFRGHTLGEIAAFEPSYIDWIARTITRDRDLVVRARVIQADLDARGVERRTRPAAPGWGRGAEETAQA